MYVFVCIYVCIDRKNKTHQKTSDNHAEKVTPNTSKKKQNHTKPSFDWFPASDDNHIITTTCGNIRVRNLLKIENIAYVEEPDHSKPSALSPDGLASK